MNHGLGDPQFIKHGSSDDLLKLIDRQRNAILNCPFRQFE